jgi:signal transduction histidine kinase
VVPYPLIVETSVPTTAVGADDARSRLRPIRVRGRTTRDVIPDPLAPLDGLAPFRPAILAIRWGTVGVGLALAYGDFQDHPALITICGAVLVAIALVRTVRPVRLDQRFMVAALAVELVLTGAVVAVSGAWSSPFAFSLITTVVVAGMARGFMSGLAFASAAVVGITAVDLLAEETDARTAVQWIAELVLVALVAGYARRILGERELEQSIAMTRIGQLADANALLFSLHRVAQALPASLDLDEALDSTMSRLADLFEYDAAALLVLDETDGAWVAARRDGVRLAPRLDTSELPRPMQRALALRTLVYEPNLLASGGPGLAPRLTSGMYAVLPARGSIIGLLAVEHSAVDRYTDRDLELLTGFVEPAALAVDNARWFGRLRTVGAEEERNRIARDLHDRIGQSLAYLAFELDRIVKAGERDDDVRPALGRLREDVRTVIREVRDTLYDLRTDVSDEQGFLATLELFVSRVRERARFAVTLRAEERLRLPLPQERELFRIAQEAIVNVERHAEAAHVTITWRADERGALLEVADDGSGFPVGRAGRLDSYGLLGMRERAASIGATLDLESSPGHGTRVRCSLPASR